MMKKYVALVLALVMAVTATGCQLAVGETIDAEPIALADGTATGTTQAIKARALSQKVTVTEIPALAERKAGVDVQQNSKATVDASNAGEGYVEVKYTGGKNVKIKVHVCLDSGNDYYHILNNAGNYETIALTEGNGKYTIRIMENTTGNKYACVFSCQVEVKLRNELLPFLYSSSTINYAAAPDSVKKAAQLTASCTTDLEKIEVIYKHVTGNVSYDYDLAKKIVAGTVSEHMPKLDVTLSTKKGICFDYAALMAGMLRSQGIPCRLVKGYAGTTYHAWINVFVKGVGWVDKLIQFDGTSWTMMDPTFVSTYGASNAVEAFVGDGGTYTPKQLF